MFTELPPPADSDDEDLLPPPADSDDDDERVSQAEDMTPFWRNPTNVSIMGSAVSTYEYYKQVHTGLHVSAFPLDWCDCISRLQEHVGSGATSRATAMHHWQYVHDDTLPRVLRVMR